MGHHSLRRGGSCRADLDRGVHLPDGQARQADRASAACPAETRTASARAEAGAGAALRYGRKQIAAQTKKPEGISSVLILKY